jgi:hypothetical protein
MIPCLKQLEHEAGKSSAYNTQVQNAYGPIASAFFL